MGHPIARLGDLLDHGGAIIEGSPNVTVNGKPVARKGDKAMCAIHGLVTISDGNPHMPINGRDCARVTSLCSCGAKIITGSPNVYSNR